MEGYEKTEKLKLNKLEGSNVVDIEAVQENFEILETEVDKVKDLELTDKKIDCTEENKKLNEVLKELRLGDETVQNHIIYLNKSIDKNVKTLQEKDANLEEAINTLKAKDVSLEEAIRVLKSESDRNHNDFVELNKIVDNSTQRDKVANDKHYEAINKIKKLIG